MVWFKVVDDEQRESSMLRLPGHYFVAEFVEFVLNKKKIDIEPDLVSVKLRKESQKVCIQVFIEYLLLSYVEWLPL